MTAACIVLGDSIGVGLSRAMPECEAQAVGGISAAGFVQRFSCPTLRAGGAGVAVISLGSNAGPSDAQYLRMVRDCQSGPVIWLLPPSRIRQLVLDLAAERGDRVVDVRDGGATAMHIHPDPAGYARLAAIVRSAEPCNCASAASKAKPG